MKRCPKCNKAYDDSFKICINDGMPLEETTIDIVKQEDAKRKQIRYSKINFDQLIMEYYDLRISFVKFIIFIVIEVIVGLIAWGFMTQAKEWAGILFILVVSLAIVVQLLDLLGIRKKISVVSKTMYDESAPDAWERWKLPISSTYGVIKKVHKILKETNNL